MSEEKSSVVVAEHVKLEKRNDEGELYETIEVTVDESGQRTRVTQRRPGLAPDEAYAKDVPLAKE